MRETARLHLSPGLHAPINDNVNAGHVRAHVGGEEESDLGDFGRSAEAAQQRLSEHVSASPSYDPTHIHFGFSIRSERSPERCYSEAYRCTSGFGIAQRVESHEVVDRAVETYRRREYPSVAKLVSVGLTLVPKNVILIDDDQSRWQALKIGHRCLQRGDSDFTALCLVAQVTTPEPLKSLGAPIWTILEQSHALRLLGFRIRHRVVERLMNELLVPALLGHNG